MDEGHELVDTEGELLTQPQIGSQLFLRPLLHSYLFVAHSLPLLPLHPHRTVSSTGDASLVHHGIVVKLFQHLQVLSLCQRRRLDVVEIGNLFIFGLE